MFLYSEDAGGFDYVKLTGSFDVYHLCFCLQTQIFIYEGERLSTERRAIFEDVEDAEKDLVSFGATVHAVKGW